MTPLLAVAAVSLLLLMIAALLATTLRAIQAFNVLKKHSRRQQIALNFANATALSAEARAARIEKARRANEDELAFLEKELTLWEQGAYRVAQNNEARTVTMQEAEPVNVPATRDGHRWDYAASKA